MNICTVIGARPQFVKAAVVSRALAAAGIRETLVHTGQHYDPQMSSVFFDELGIPTPATNLGIGSGTHAAQTGRMMIELERFLSGQATPPDAVLVYGDTNSTLAAALVAAKLQIPLAHVEAGLRSFNRAMPEEINRIVTDRLSRWLFCPSHTAIDHLRAEGITEGVYFTGDVMYDVLLHFRPLAQERHPLDALVPFESGSYVLLTLHRAENTDDPARLHRLMQLVDGLGRAVVWPLHPRTRERLTTFGIGIPAAIHVMEPVGYLAMLSLLGGAAAVLTDSGGLQKEAYWCARPCLTLRSETEWVETLEDGWNTVVGADPERAAAALSTPPQGTPQPCYGTGDAAKRIADILARDLA